MVKQVCNNFTPGEVNKLFTDTKKFTCNFKTTTINATKQKIFQFNDQNFVRKEINADKPELKEGDDNAMLDEEMDY